MTLPLFTVGAIRVHNGKGLMEARHKQEAFEAAVREEIPTLFRVALRMCGNSEKAEDIVQNTLINAYRAFDRFDGRHLRSWLISILRNEFYGTLRKRDDDVSLDAVENYATEEPFWAEVEWRDAADRILDEVDRLPNDFKMTLLLCDVEQMSYEQVAQTMEVPIGTVRSRLFRARSLIRRKLGVSLALEGE